MILFHSISFSIFIFLFYKGGLDRRRTRAISILLLNFESLCFSGRLVILLVESLVVRRPSLVAPLRTQAIFYLPHRVNVPSPEVNPRRSRVRFSARANI